MADFRDFQTIKAAPYKIDVEWTQLEFILERYEESQKQFGYKFELNPIFQRGHVWTEAQQIAFVEWVVKGGQSGLDIYFNHPKFRSNYKADMVLIDGLQRLTAVRRFLAGEIGIFGGLKITDFNTPPYNLYFRFHICELKTEAEILKWYLDFNSAGTVHSQDELTRVSKLLADVTNELFEDKESEKLHNM